MIRLCCPSSSRSLSCTRNPLLALGSLKLPWPQDASRISEGYVYSLREGIVHAAYEIVPKLKVKDLQALIGESPFCLLSSGPASILFLP